jgi:hypothetical protein
VDDLGSILSAKAKNDGYQEKPLIEMAGETLPRGRLVLADRTNDKTGTIFSFEIEILC